MASLSLIASLRVPQGIVRHVSFFDCYHVDELLTDSGREGVTAFSCVLTGKPPDSNGSSKLMATQMALVKVSGSQNKTKRHACVKRDLRVGGRLARMAWIYRGWRREQSNLNFQRISLMNKNG